MRPPGGAPVDATGCEAHQGPLVQPEHQVDPRHAAGKGCPGHCDIHGDHVDPQLLAVHARILLPAVQPASPKSHGSQCPIQLCTSSAGAQQHGSSLGEHTVCDTHTRSYATPDRQCYKVVDMRGNPMVTNDRTR